MWLVELSEDIPYISANGWQVTEPEAAMLEELELHLPLLPRKALTMLDEAIAEMDGQGHDGRFNARHVYVLQGVRHRIALGAGPHGEYVM